MLRILLLAAVTLPLCAQFRYSWPFSTLESTGSTTTFDSAASGGYSQTWFDVGFLPAASKTLSKVRFNVSGVTGTLATNDICIALYADATSGDPGPVIETRCTVTSTPTGAAWVEVTGFTTALTQNTPYHLVVLNADAAPTTNFFQTNSLTTTNGALGANGWNLNGGYQLQTSTNGGLSWTAAQRLPGYVIEYSDGTREGFAYKSATTMQIYGTRKGGLEITIAPNGPHLAFRGIIASVAKTGSPTSLKLSVLKGTGNSRTAICTPTGNIAGALMGTGRHTVLAWCAEGRVLVSPGDTISIVGETTNTSDASTNRTNFGIVQLWSQDSDLMSTGYRLRSVFSTDGGSTWSTTSDEFAQLALILDDTRPLQSISGGFAITQ